MNGDSARNGAGSFKIGKCWCLRKSEGKDLQPKSGDVDEDGVVSGQASKLWIRLDQVAWLDTNRA